MDDIIKNTLTGTMPTVPATPQGLMVPDLTGNNQADIKTLSAAQQQPSLLMNFQKVMQNASRQAYQERQASELSNLGNQFDPTKVSGGTFGSIISTLEQNRGGDVSKIYGSTMNAYAKSQEQITQRLQYLQELEENKRQFEMQMKLKKEELKETKKYNKEEYKMKKEQFEMDKKSWELTYEKAKQKLKTSISALDVFGMDDYGDNVLDMYRKEYNAGASSGFDPNAYLGINPSGVRYDSLGQGISTQY